jgi:hypothetical protein
MKVLLCLLSDQHVPNLLSVHHFRPDHLVLVESEQMKGKSNALLAALKTGEGNDQLDYAERCTIVPLKRVNSLQHVLEELNQKAIQAFPDADWLVNLTGGNKLMALAAFQCFALPKARRFYIEQNQPRTMIFLDLSAPEDCAHKISMSKFLAGYGYELRRTAHESQQLAAYDLTLWETSRVLAEQATPNDVFDFDRKEHDQARKNGIVVSNARLEKLHLSVRLALEKHFGVYPDRSINLDKFGGDFVTGGWLEVFVWGLLAKNAQALGIHDVQRSVKPYRPGDHEANDMDVAFMDDQMALVMVECKSGQQQHGGAMDIFYKVNSVVGQSQALKAKAILATTSNFLLDPQRPGELKDRAKELSSLFKLKLVLRDEIQELARRPNDVEYVREVFLSRR